MKNTLYYIILLSGIIPATLLLGLTLYLLPRFISNMDISTKSILTLTSMVLGICGYCGLCLLFSKRHFEFFKTKLTLLLSGILGSILFISLEGGYRAWKWILTMQEPGEWFLIAWPTIVAMVFCIIIIRNKWIARHAENKPALTR